MRSKLALNLYLNWLWFRDLFSIWFQIYALNSYLCPNFRFSLPNFNAVLIVVLRIYNVLWHHPQPVRTNEPDARCKWFEVHICNMLNYCNALIDKIGLNT